MGCVAYLIAHELNRHGYSAFCWTCCTGHIASLIHIVPKLQWMQLATCLTCDKCKPVVLGKEQSSVVALDLQEFETGCSVSVVDVLLYHPKNIRSVICCSQMVVGVIHYILVMLLF